MSFLSTLSIKSKIGLGLILSYTSFEVYLQIRTQYLIKQRRNEFLKLDDGVDKFRSATIAGMFVNPFEEYRPQTAFEFIFVRIFEFFESLYGSTFEVHKKINNGEEVEDVLKTFKPNLDIYKRNSKILQSCIENGNFSSLSSIRYEGIPLKHQLLFSWLGQSCSLIQISGINFLTDPIISDHLISEHFGPKRLNKSPMTFEDIQYATNNNLNFILVSHDHPDHLELDLASKINNNSIWIVPVGLKSKLARQGIYRIIEMDWWDKIDITKFIDEKFPDKIEVECVPSMHWSGRYVIDSNKSLWCSFIVKKNGQSVLYHAGDTGYSKDLFKLIGERIGPVFLSLLPIGQYCPKFHQRPRHISPSESLKICQDINTKFMKGIHWGTFKLSSEPILEPKNLLTKLCKDQPNYNVPEFGLTYLYDLQNAKEITSRLN